MKQTITRILSVIVSLAIAFTAAPGVSASESDATVLSYEDQLAEIARKKESALDELDSIRSNQASQLTEAEALEELITLNAKQRELAEGILESLNRQIAEKTAVIEETNAKIAAQEEAHRERMVASYMEQEIDVIELILGSQSLVDFLTRVDSANAIFEYDRKIIDELETNRRLLETEQAALDNALIQQTERVKEYEDAVRGTQEAYEAKLAYLEELKQNEAAWVAEYVKNREMEDALNAELEAYLAELAEKQRREQENHVYVGGETKWPLEYGVWYKITSLFGWRTLDGIPDNHYGVDIAVPNGTPVLAYNSGTVIVSDNHWSYGEYIILDHGGGVTTLYAHMSERLYGVGDTVNAGDTIGYVGLTGNTKGYHLHFETRENGSRVDPAGYLAFPEEVRYY